MLVSHSHSLIIICAHLFDQALLHYFCWMVTIICFLSKLKYCLVSSVGK